MEHKAVRTLYIFVSFKIVWGYVRTVPDEFSSVHYVDTALLHIYALFTQNFEWLGI